MVAEPGRTEDLVPAASADYVFDTTGVPQLMSLAVTSLAFGGTAALANTVHHELVLAPGALSGRTVRGAVMGHAVPAEIVPRMIELWRQGRFPFDRLVTLFPLSEINEAEAALVKQDVIKAVLVP